MPVRIRFEHADDRESDRAIIDELWQAYYEEAITPDVLRTLTLGRARDYPTGRFMLGQADDDTYIAVAGAVLPGDDARYGFENYIGFPHPALPTSERGQLGEGRLVYVTPEHRREGLAWALTFLSMALCWDAGAAYIASVNAAVSLDMAQSVGFENTGLVMTHDRRGPYYLMVGRTREVLAASWPAARQALERFSLAPDVQALLDRWSAAA